MYNCIHLSSPIYFGLCIGDEKMKESGLNGCKHLSNLIRL